MSTAPATSNVTPITVVASAVTIDPKWHEFGAADATDENAYLARIPLYAMALRGADYATWVAFRSEYCKGAEAAGYARPDDLYSRRVLMPLKGLSIERPTSPTSTNARTVSAETQAKRDKAKAEGEALAAMTPAEIKAEIDSKSKPSQERLAKLYTALVSAEKTIAKDAAKKIKDANGKMLAACKELLGTMDAKELESAHRALSAIIGKRK